MLSIIPYDSLFKCISYQLAHVVRNIVEQLGQTTRLEDFDHSSLSCEAIGPNYGLKDPSHNHLPHELLGQTIDFVEMLGQITNFLEPVGQTTNQKILVTSLLTGDYLRMNINDILDWIFTFCKLKLFLKFIALAIVDCGRIFHLSFK